MYTPRYSVWLQHTISHLVPRLPGYFLCSTLVINHLLGTVRNGGIVKNSCQSLGVKERLHINKYTLCIHPVSTCHCTKLPNSGTVSKVTWKHFSEMGWSACQCFCVCLHILSSVQDGIYAHGKAQMGTTHLSEFPPMLPLKRFHHQQWARDWSPHRGSRSRNAFQPVLKYLKQGL